MYGPCTNNPVKGNSRQKETHNIQEFAVQNRVLEQPVPSSSRSPKTNKKDSVGVRL